MPLQETLKHSKAGLAQSLVRSLGPHVHKFLFELSPSLLGIGFDSKHDFAPPTIYWDFSFVLGCGYLFWWNLTFSC